MRRRWGFCKGLSLYVHPGHGRTGVAAALLAEVLAQERRGAGVAVDASRAALPFFLRRGFARQRENRVYRHGVALVHYRLVHALLWVGSLERRQSWILNVD